MSGLQRVKEAEVVGLGWLAARVWVGWKFLDAGWDKVTGEGKAAWVGDNAGVAVKGYLQGALDKAPGGAAAGDHPEVAGWYADLIRDLFLPHAKLFSYLVAYGEVLVGVALILGVLTRFSAAMGLVMSFAFLLAGTSSDNPLMVLLAMPIVLVGASAGYYGVDRYLIPAMRRRIGGREQTPKRPALGRPVPGTS